MSLTRRDFLLRSGQGLVLSPFINAAALAAHYRDGVDAARSRALVLLPTALVPRTCRVTHSAFAPVDPPRPWRLPFADEIHIFRPHDLLNVRFSFHGLRAVTRSGFDILERTEKSAFVCVRFASQHAVEPDFDPLVSPVLPKPPFAVLSSGPSQLVFEVAGDELPYTLGSLLDWRCFVPHVSSHSLPPLTTLRMEGGKRIATTVRPPGLGEDGQQQEPCKIDVGDREVPIDHPSIDTIVDQRGRPVTAIEMPFGMYLSNHRWSMWRNSAIQNGGRQDERDGRSRQFELWHTWLDAARTKPGDADLVPDAEARSDLKTVRVIHYRTASDTQDGDFPIRLMPASQHRFEIAHETSNFRDMEYEDSSGQRLGAYKPVDVTVKNLILTSLGATVDLKMETDPDGLVNVKDPSLDLNVMKWVHQSTAGRDNFVEVRELGCVLPTGHIVVYVEEKLRKFDMFTCGDKEVPAAAIKARYYYSIVKPERTYALPHENVYDIIGREWCFSRLRIRESQSPDVKRRKLDIPKEWIQAKNSDAYYEFTFDGVDRSGESCSFKMPLLWVPMSVAKLVGNNEDLKSAIQEYCHAINPGTGRKARHVRMPVQRIAFAPKHSNGRSAAHGADPSLPVSELLLRVDVRSDKTVVWSDGEGNDGACGETDQPEPKFPAEEAWGLRFHPALQWARARVDAAEALSNDGLQSGLRVRYNPTYVGQGFAAEAPGGNGSITHNKAELFLDVHSGDLRLQKGNLNFSGAKSGGLCTPSYQVAHLSRQLGPVGQAAKDEGEGAERAGRSEKSLSLYRGEFDPTAFFKKMAEVANLIGGVKLIEVIAPIADTVAQASRVPRLLAEQVDGVLEDVNEVRTHLASVKATLEAGFWGELDRVRAKANELLHRVVKTLADELELELMKQFRLLAVPTEQILSKLVEDAEAWVRDHAANSESLRAKVATIFRSRELAEILNAWTSEEWSPEALKMTLRHLVVTELREDIAQELLKKIDGWVDASLVVVVAGKKLTVYIKEIVDDANRSLPRICQKIVADIEKHVTPAMYEALLAASDFEPVAAELRNGYADAVTAVESLRQFPLAALDRIREELKTVIGLVLDNNPLRNMGELWRHVQRLGDELNQLRLGSEFDPPVSFEDELANFEAACGKAMAAVRAWQATVVEHTTKAMLVKKMQAFEAALETIDQPELKARALQQWRDARVNVYQELGPQVDETVNEWRGLLDGANRTIEPVIVTFKDTMADVNAGLTELKSAVRAVTEQIKSIRDRLPKEVAIDYNWKPKLQDAPKEDPLFEARSRKGEATFELQTKIRKTVSPEEMLNRSVSPPTASIHGELRNFTIHLLPKIRFISVEFEHLIFDSKNGSKPDVQVKLDRVILGEELEFVRKFASLFNPSNGFFCEIGGSELQVGYRYNLPTFAMGVLSIADLSIGVIVSLDFTGGPLRLECYVSRRNKPFLVNVGILTGGGYFGLLLSPKGIERIEGSIEFGAGIYLNIAGIAVGRARVTAGIYFSYTNREATVFGFVCASGSLKIIGLITVSLELYLSLGYIRRDGQSLVAGEVKVTVEIDFCFFSVTVRFTYYKEFEGSNRSGGSQPPSMAAMGPGGGLLESAGEKGMSSDDVRARHQIIRRQWGKRRKRLLKSWTAQSNRLHSCLIQ